MLVSKMFLNVGQPVPAMSKDKRLEFVSREMEKVYPGPLSDLEGDVSKVWPAPISISGQESNRKIQLTVVRMFRATR